MDYRIIPPGEIIETSVALPASKSVANRAIVIDALAGTLPDVDEQQCDDTRLMAEAVNAPDGSTVDLGDSGTALRFLTAYFASREGCRMTLTGSRRLLERPLRPLVDALTAMGASIAYTPGQPVEIEGRRLSGGEVTLDGSLSSQFASALMLIAPTLAAPTTITLTGETVSAAYIDLTADLMRRAGADVEREANVVTVKPSAYAAGAVTDEGDWSAAAFWYEIQALSSGFITLSNLDYDSLQPDRAARRIFESLGVDTTPGEEGGVDLMATPDLTPRFTADLTDNPDMAPALAVGCTMLRIPFRLTGLSTLRHKESDRLEAIRAELSRLGAVVEIEGDSALVWEGLTLPIAEIPAFDTHGDHRIAMALAPISLYVPGIVVRDIEVVDKSYPTFWDDLRRAGFRLLDPGLPLGDDGETPREEADGL